MAYSARYASPLGEIHISFSDVGLHGLWFTGQTHDPLISLPAMQEHPIAAETFRYLDDYFTGKLPSFSDPLLPAGTDYQKTVWALLLAIPYGKTCTYGQLAEAFSERTGHKTSPRAVGSAVGRNPISILIPCHRVLGSGGSLTGYAGGLDRKSALLRIEGLLP